MTLIHLLFITSLTCCNFDNNILTADGLPLKAAWCKALNPLLLVTVKEEEKVMKRDCQMPEAL
jgi:hypothetical protein